MGCVLFVPPFVGLFLASVRLPLCRGIHQMPLLEQGRLPSRGSQTKPPAFRFHLSPTAECRNLQGFRTPTLTFLGKYGSEKKISSLFSFPCAHFCTGFRGGCVCVCVVIFSLNWKD